MHGPAPRASSSSSRRAGRGAAPGPTPLAGCVRLSGPGPAGVRVGLMNTSRHRGGGRQARARRLTRQRRHGAGLRVLTVCIAATLLVFGMLQFWHCGTKDCASHLSNDASHFLRQIAGVRAAPSSAQSTTWSWFQSHRVELPGDIPGSGDAYLESATLQDLRDRAVEAGASKTAVMEARNADNAKLAMYSLIHTAQKERAQAAETAARTAADRQAADFAEDLEPASLHSPRSLVSVVVAPLASTDTMGRQ